jgi:hypothetical protein
VSHEREFVCHDGAAYQARKDTAQTPGSSDWVCLARAGRDVCVGRTPNIRGTYGAHKTYQRLDIVAMDGASFIAKYDNSGVLPRRWLATSHRLHSSTAFTLLRDMLSLSQTDMSHRSGT